MKKVYIISTSLRPDSNSDYVARHLEKSALAAGNQVEYVRLLDKEIRFCTGCLACQKTEQCVQMDDAVPIANKIKQAEVLVFATPIYYY